MDAADDGPLRLYLGLGELYLLFFPLLLAPTHTISNRIIMFRHLYSPRATTGSISK